MSQYLALIIVLAKINSKFFLLEKEEMNRGQKSWQENQKLPLLK